MTVISVRNAYTGEYDYEFTQATADEVRETCARVRGGQAEWAALGVEGRIAVLQEFAAAVTENFAAIAGALKTDEARAAIAEYEVAYLTPLVERMAGDARKMLVDPAPRPAMLPGIEGSGQWVPYEVIGCIGPWNFPFLLIMVDAVPALLAGSAVVAKPSEVNPRFVEPVRAALAQVPKLARVFDFVMGPGETGAELINHVDLVVFTGSVRTGRIVGEAAARNFIPAFLELGGKDPAIVLESANIEAATSCVLRASVGATGQACQSLERIYVADSIYDEFVGKVVEKAKGVTLNIDKLEQGHLGPLIFDKQASIIQDHLDDAVAKGAKILTGGKIIEKGGKWIEPTVLTDVNHDMKVMTEETFGPVIPIMKFKTVDEAVALANDTIYGLSGSVFAGSTEEAMAVARRMNAGAISINDGSLTAFVNDVPNEAFGFSGLGGTRFGSEGILRFVRLKSFLNNVVGPTDVNNEIVPLDPNAAQTIDAPSRPT